MGRELFVRFIRVWICCTLFARIYVFGQLNLSITRNQMRSSWSMYLWFISYRSDYFRINSWILKCKLIRQLFCYPTARDFTSFHHLFVDLDFGSDIFLIKNGVVTSLFQRPEALYQLIAPLPTNLNEVKFTWNSYPSVSRPFFLWVCWWSASGKQQENRLSASFNETFQLYYDMSLNLMSIFNNKVLILCAKILGTASLGRLSFILGPSVCVLLGLVENSSRVWWIRLVTVWKCDFLYTMLYSLGDLASLVLDFSVVWLF